MTTHTLLVYGSLRTGDRPLVHIPGRLYDFGLWPGAVYDADNMGTIACEEHKVTDEQLADLDHYEGFVDVDFANNLFNRIKLPTGEWFYEINTNRIDNKRLVFGGDWLVHKELQKGHASQMLTRA